MGEANGVVSTDTPSTYTSAHGSASEGVSVSLGTLSIRQLMELSGALKLRGLGFALGVALNLGPTLRDAAEAAIRSPLLEDVNLAGARGILVNITAGMNLSIGEFDEVGNTVKEFAHDEATVVVGTVIDPDLQEEMRVTVVATGLGVEKQVAHPPVRLVQPEEAEPAPTLGEYRDMDRPTVIRQGQKKAASGYGGSGSDVDMDYLDIPAFLRRQAD